jgi:hypothetical protein
VKIVGKEKDFDNVPCEKCNTPMFAGWVENPIFQKSGKGFQYDGEGILEMFVGYCPKCNTVVTKVLEGTQIYKEAEKDIDFGYELAYIWKNNPSRIFQEDVLFKELNIPNELRNGFALACILKNAYKYLDEMEREENV